MNRLRLTSPPLRLISQRAPAVCMSPHVGRRGRQVLFASFSLPGYAGELHLVYDYRLGVPSGSLEPFFTLHLACEQGCAWQGRSTEAADRLE